jgi:tRNA threonylcarbamoyladenosine biosynthesis protein TsaB
MYILHIETSTAVCSVALSRNGSMVALHETREGMNHTALLAPFIQQILESVSLKPEALGAIAVSSGPGSYTGLRVGGSTAKAMAYSLGIPLVAVPTLESLAGAIFEKHPGATYALPMIDARRKEVYTALYDHTLKEVWPVSSVILTEDFFLEKVAGLEQLYIGGDGAVKVAEMGALGQTLRVDVEIECSARHQIASTLDRIAQGKVVDPMHFVPDYLKPPNITVSKKHG